jgi:ABC-type sugar transport system ATPase subunit
VPDLGFVSQSGGQNDMGKQISDVEGKAVLVSSPEHQELFGRCDRILIMGEGRLRGELTAVDSFRSRSPEALHTKG